MDDDKSSVTVKANKCLRCGHIWMPRTKPLGTATVCPKCKSPYWNKDLTLHGLKQREEILRPLTEIRVCPKCQAQNAPVAIYCHKCGATFATLDEAEMIEHLLASPRLKDFVYELVQRAPKYQGGENTK